MKEIKIWLYPTSRPIIRENVTNAYVKDGLYCVYTEDNNMVEKFPLCNVFMISEPYGDEQ